MKLAVSNIAWSASDEREMIGLLSLLGVPYAEIAPSKIFEDPSNVSHRDARRYRDLWEASGIEVWAFQSLLFERPELEIFGDETARRRTVDYLGRVAELAGTLGARRMVFGSPKNRRVPDNMTIEQADDIAAEFFSELGRIAADNDTCFCIEPNPTVYGCNYVTSTAAGVALVSRVNQVGFGLHLDTAAMALEGEDIFASVLLAPQLLQHFHISAPNLEPIEEIVVDHSAAAAGLLRAGYEHVVSVEMRAGPSSQTSERVALAVATARRYYGVI